MTQKPKKQPGYPAHTDTKKKEEKEEDIIRYLRKGKIYRPIKVGDYGDLFHGKNAVCIDCGAHYGEEHKSGCDYEICPRCGHYIMNCKCGPIYEIDDGATEEEIEGIISPSASGSSRGTS